MTMALRGVLVSLLFLCALLSFKLGAGESDIEFARRLLAVERPDFQTDDLVEHLAKQVRADAARAPEAALIDALVRVNQARSVSAERRAELLASAEERCRAALAAPKNSETQRAAQQEYGGVLKQWLRSVRDLTKKNPAQAKIIGADAARAQESIVAERKTETDANFAAFDALYKEYVNAGGAEKVKPEFLRRMGLAFDAWIASDGRYTQAAADWIECFEEGAAQRKTQSDVLLKYFEKVDEQGAIDEFPVVAAWYHVQRGRFLALAGDAAKATEVWREVLAERGASLAPPQRKGIAAVRRSVAYDLAKLLEQRSDWGGLIAHIESLIKDGDMGPLFDEDRGLEIRLDYARALTRQDRADVGDFDQALRDLKRVVELEKKRGSRPAAVYQISRATADVLNEARRQKMNLRVDGEQSYLAGYGLFVSGEQKILRRNELAANDPRRVEIQKGADDDYLAAARLYQQSILVISKGEPAQRLRLEVKARNELTLCFYRMNQRYEAVAAAWALLDAFAPDFVEQQTAKVPEARRRALSNELNSAWTQALPMFEKTYRIQDAMRADIRKTNQNPLDVWNKEFVASVTRRSPWDEKFSLEDPSYAAGAGLFEQARRVIAEARSAKEENAQKELAQKAQDLLSEAEKQFSKVAAGKYALPALFQRALERVQFFEVLQLVKANEKELVASGRRAIEAIEQYERVAQNEVSPLWTDEKKSGATGALLLARASVEFSCLNFEAARQAADSYLIWIQKNSIQNGAVAQAQLLKFRALAALLESNPDDALLAEAEKTFEEATKSTDDTRRLIWMADTLMRLQQKKVSATAADAKSVYAQLARLQTRKLGLLAQEMSEPVQFAEQTRRLSYLEKSGDAAETISAAEDILKRFDPENKNARIADDAWPALLTRMAGGNGQAGVIDYADLNQRDRCRQEHRILVDLMYDTAAAALPENDAQRPADDRLNANLERAAVQVEKIRKNFSTAQTLDPKRGDNGIALLQIVADEIDFRRRMLSVRDLLLKRSMEQAEALQNSAPQKAERYRTVAAGQLKLLMEQGETPALNLQLAQLYLQTKKYAEALDVLLKVRSIVGDDRPEYFDAMKLTALVYAEQGKWEDAAEYPRFVMQTAGLESRIVRERWRDLGAFLEKCYANGAKRPAARR